MMVTAETATVYRGGGRRFLTRKAAIRAEAVSIIKRKHPSERSEHDERGQCTDPGWHWESLPRSDVLLRRVCRLVDSTFKARAALKENTNG